MLVISHQPKGGFIARIIQLKSRCFLIIKQFLILFLLLTGMSNVSAGEIKQETKAVDVPALSKRVTDISKVLTKEENQRLTRQLKKLQSEKEVQMAVLIIPTTGRDTVEEFASRVFEQWKLGSKERNDGILFLIASDDHKMRIAVGSGLERELTDGKIARILREDVKPAFKENAYFEGTSNAIDSMNILLKKPGQAEIQDETSKLTQALEENDSALNKISGKDIAALFGFWLVCMFLLPMKVFRTGHWFKRLLKCVLTIVAGTCVLDFVGAFPSIPGEFYLLILLSPVILVFLLISSVKSLLKSLFGSLFGGLFGGSGSKTSTAADSIKTAIESTKTTTDSTKGDDDDDRFSGGGGRRDGGGASGSW
ncbi:hypothetical protein Xbed_02619 [Xenorhabdus beddingii]|uniref:TPM domain-containing protein n=1 Tax=Xenorhabdus beddingii TaxID=40578 RepID=A0A1Y2SMA0_9GAMM|nr:TPM domain-containing protein [Xenorhabdus beddingii]OTA19222.1 hypothetical protein Xbed_02619 [Xenorhabdus beddingii]